MCCPHFLFDETIFAFPSQIIHIVYEMNIRCLSRVDRCQQDQLDRVCISFYPSSNPFC